MIEQAIGIEMVQNESSINSNELYFEFITKALVTIISKIEINTDDEDEVEIEI
jgi:hypothetical protein